MPLNPHTSPKCRFCMHSKRNEKTQQDICNHQESVNYLEAVHDEAYYCPYYLPETNQDDYKEQINGGW